MDVRGRLLSTREVQESHEAIASCLACVYKIIEHADDVSKFLGSNCVSLPVML